MRNCFRTADTWAWYYHVAAASPPLFGRAGLISLWASDPKLASEPHPMKTQRQIRKVSTIGNDKGRLFLRKDANRSALTGRKCFSRLSSMACVTPFVLGILVGIAPSETAYGTPSVFTWASASTGTSWLNSANWTGGPVNKAPGIDSNASSTIDNDPNDTATFGTLG